MRAKLPWLVAALVLVVDRATKLAVMRAIRPGDAHIVFDRFSITHVHNRGIAFSLFADGGHFTRVLLPLVILATVAVITWILLRDRSGSTVVRIALGAILGGALGNLADRLLYGWVVDFLHFWIRIGQRAYSWPDFNVADAAISLGAVALVLHEILASRKPPRNEVA